MFQFFGGGCDHEGVLAEAFFRCTYGSVSPEMAEATGIRETLSWVKKQAGKGFVVETNCLDVIQEIRSSAINLSYLGRTIEKCKKLLVRIKRP